MKEQIILYLILSGKTDISICNLGNNLPALYLSMFVCFIRQYKHQFVVVFVLLYLEFSM